ncbi:hypothetical protein PMAYCL1PPCAC_17667, partial [Pristionchus mayeri]
LSSLSMLCTGSDFSSPHPLDYDDCLQADVDVRENGKWRKREVSIYRQRRLRDSVLVIRKKKGGPIEREFALDSLCGIMMEMKEGVRFPLLISFPRDIVRIGFKLIDSIPRWKGFIERICGQSTVISSLTLEHTPFLPSFSTLGHAASLLVIGSRFTIIDHNREEVVHSAPLTHLEMVTAIDNSLWISFDDLRKNPDEYFSLESKSAREILKYFAELRRERALRFKMLPYKTSCSSRGTA